MIGIGRRSRGSSQEALAYAHLLYRVRETRLAGVKEKGGMGYHYTDIVFWQFLHIN